MTLYTRADALYRELGRVAGGPGEENRLKTFWFHQNIIKLYPKSEWMNKLKRIVILNVTNIETYLSPFLFSLSIRFCFSTSMLFSQYPWFVVDRNVLAFWAFFDSLLSSPADDGLNSDAPVHFYVSRPWVERTFLYILCLSVYEINKKSLSFM